jgi:5-methyltetrahydropteroyltriglutamate--homocysteine methyltransferase
MSPTTSITTSAAGSYPKTPHEGRPSRLGRAIQAHRNGEIDEARLRRVEDDLVEEVIAEQVRAGIDLVTDGQVRWTDAQAPFARKLTGFTIAIDDPAPYFHTGAGYQRPHVTGMVGWGGPVTIDDWGFASSISDVPVKQVITGPYSLVKLSRNEHYRAERDLVLDVARVLNQEAFELEAAGCAYIQFDEPAVVRHPGPAGSSKGFDLLAEASDILTNGLAVTTEIRTYFGAVQEPPDDFFALPFRVFGLDLVDGLGNWDLVKQFPGGRTLAAGLVDGRNADLEPEDSLAADIRRLLEFVPAEQLQVTPSCGLGYLSRDQAEAKLVRLVRAVRAGV